MIRRPPRSTQSRSSAASDVYKRQLRAHAVLIVCFAALVTVTAGALSYQQPPTYTSVARVVVEPQLLPNGGAPPAPDMATEKVVATSDSVTTAAAAALGLPLDQAS